jgi:hypothetical protein
VTRPEGVWRLPSGLLLRPLTTVRRGDRGRWAAAASLDDLCHLTVGWLTGEIGSQPGYYGQVDVDEDQAPGLTAALIALNAAGVCTRSSQAGFVGTGADGALWIQHAAVTGYADTDAWHQLLQAVDGTRYHVLAHVVRPRQHRASPGVVATWRDGQPYTEFGAQLTAVEVRFDLDGAGTDAVTAAVGALQVTVWDPTPGANTLWEHLVGDPASAPTLMPRPEPITDPTLRPVCHGCGSTRLAAVTTHPWVGQFQVPADMPGPAARLSAWCEVCGSDLNEPGWVLPAGLASRTWAELVASAATCRGSQAVGVALKVAEVDR